MADEPIQTIYQVLEEARNAGARPDQIAAIPEGYWQGVVVPSLQAKGYGDAELAKMKEEWRPGITFYADRVARNLDRRPETLAASSGQAEEALIQPADLVAGAATAPKMAGKVARSVLTNLPFIPFHKVPGGMVARIPFTKGYEIGYGKLPSTGIGNAVTSGFNEGARTLNAPPASVLSSFLNLLRTTAQAGKPAVAAGAQPASRETLALPPGRVPLQLKAAPPAALRGYGLNPIPLPGSSLGPFPLNRSSAEAALEALHTTTPVY